MPGEQTRPEGGKFGPRIPLSDEEEAVLGEARARNRLVKFGDVLDAMEAVKRVIRTPAVSRDASNEEVVDAGVDEIRSKLLFQGNPVIYQKLAPFEKQGASAQAAMGRGAPRSIARRVGGTGFAADDAPIVQRAIPRPAAPAKKKKGDSKKLRR